jgi:AraC-like DNA-binding protein
MKNLLDAVKKTLCETPELPFAVYSSVYEQHLLNVPIVKPLLVVVLKGVKKLGQRSELVCHSGEFVFLSDNPALNMRNVPNDDEYFALLIEFDYEDFKGLTFNELNQGMATNLTDDIVKDCTRLIEQTTLGKTCIGQTTEMLKRCLQQFVESAQWAPKSLWSLRKREIIALLYYMGHIDVLSLSGRPKIGHRLHELFCDQGFYGLSIETICNKLAMSESTLRRKLKLEGTSVQEVKDNARLGLGLNLLQTTVHSIGVIADKCGYQSQSRFTDRFKGRFGLTPSELRKTKMAE